MDLFYKYIDFQNKNILDDNYNWLVYKIAKIHDLNMSDSDSHSDADSNLSDSDSHSDTDSNLSDSASHSDSDDNTDTMTYIQRNDQKSRPLFELVIEGQGYDLQEIFLEWCDLNSLGLVVQVNKNTKKKSMELYKRLFKNQTHVYTGNMETGKRLLGRALSAGAPDVLISTMLDVKPDEVGEKVEHNWLDKTLPLQIAVLENCSLYIVQKIFLLTAKHFTKKNQAAFIQLNSNCLQCAIMYHRNSERERERSQQIALFLLHELPTLISTATPEYANIILKGTLSNEIGSEVICRILELNDKLIDFVKKFDPDCNTYLLLILNMPNVDDYINVLNIISKIDRKHQINETAHPDMARECVIKYQNSNGVDALEIAMDKNCSEAVINSLCGFDGFGDVFKSVNLLDYVSYEEGVLALSVNFATYAIIGKMNEPAVLRILREGRKVHRRNLRNYYVTRFNPQKIMTHTLLSIAINAKYGLNVIKAIYEEDKSASTKSYNKRYPNNTTVMITFPFHDFLYASLEVHMLMRAETDMELRYEEYTRILHEMRQVGMYRETCSVEWDAMFHNLFGGEVFHIHKKRIEKQIASTSMIWCDTFGLRTEYVYPLEFVVRLGLASKYVETLYLAYPEAIQHNNYAVIFHSLRCINNGTLYEDVILFLLDKLRTDLVASEFDSNKEPWNGLTPLSIALQKTHVSRRVSISPRSAEVIDAIQKKFPPAVTPHLIMEALVNDYSNRLILKMFETYSTRPVDKGSGVIFADLDALSTNLLNAILSKKNFGDYKAVVQYILARNQIIPTIELRYGARLAEDRLKHNYTQNGADVLKLLTEFVYYI